VPAKPLSLEVLRSGDSVTVRAAGDLDLATVVQLDGLLAEEEQDAATVVVDLRAVRFIDSSGLAVLLAAHQRARRRGARFVAVHGDGTPVAQVFAQTALDRAFETTTRPPPETRTTS
jgi:anti-sigma B factor antagonist